MERILLDGSTLMSAARLLGGEDKPSAYNFTALALLIESVILHDAVVVLDTSTDPTNAEFSGEDGPLPTAANTYGAGAVTVHRQTVRELVVRYVALEHPELSELMTSELTPQERRDVRYGAYDVRNAVDRAGDDLRTVLHRDYYGDDEMANYLHRLDQLYEAQLPARKVPRVEAMIGRLPRRAAESRPIEFISLAGAIVDLVSGATHARHTQWEAQAAKTPLRAFKADAQMQAAWEDFVEEYSNVSGQSPWQDYMLRSRSHWAEFDRSLLLRTHFYILASEVFAAPYRPDALRTPICLKFFRQGSFAEMSFEERMVDAAENMAKSRIKGINDFMGRRAFVALPFFLARVLRESKSRHDVINVTRQLRESDEAIRFREHLRLLRQAEEGEDIEDIYREIKQYEALLRREFGEAETSLEVVWSIGTSLGKAAALPTPGAAVDLAATTAKGLTAAPGALSRWWYRRKVALISKTIHQGQRARGLQAEINRLFDANLDSFDIAFLEYLDELTTAKNVPINES